MSTEEPSVDLPPGESIPPEPQQHHPDDQEVKVVTHLLNLNISIFEVPPRQQGRV